MSMTFVGQSTDNRSRIILGVDDVPENLFLLKRIIERGGFLFMSAASGTECLEVTGRLVPRLILLDIEMPEMDGFETCRKLRQNPQLRNVPVAYLTARKTSEDVKAGLAAGGN